ncbi:MAG: hypothetical protein V9G19_15800 [Tetrasphaera sp.]
MLTLETAGALAAAGILWEPAAGDRFAIAQDELAGEVFWISDLTIEVHHYEDQTILGFNGTTEWALDSVPLEVAIWLPREEQLRELIGDRLLGLRRAGDGWEVTIRSGEQEASFVASDAEEAYAAALLAISAT